MPQSFKNTTTDDLLAAVLKAVLDESGVDPAAIGDIVIGNVLLPGAGAVSARWGMHGSLIIRLCVCG
jgi:acetyl-CoA acyltransferase 1